jgi:hypothetical protein
MNQMALSAASVAVIYNNETLNDLATLQQAQYEMNAGTLNAGLKASEIQGESDKKNQEDAANVAIQQAICGFGGAIAGGAVSIGLIAFGGASSVGNAEQGSQLKLGMASEGTEMTNFASSGSGPAARLGAIDDNGLPAPANTNASARLAVDEPAEAANRSNAPATTSTAATEASKGKGEYWAQTSSTFGQLLNTTGQSLGNIVSYDDQIDEGHQKQTSDLENGIAQALQSLAGMIGSQLQSTDGYRSNEFQLMNALIHTSPAA